MQTYIQFRWLRRFQCYENLNQMKSKSDFLMLGLKKSFIIVSNFEIFWSIPWQDIPAKQIFST